MGNRSKTVDLIDVLAFVALSGFVTALEKLEPNGAPPHLHIVSPMKVVFAYFLKGKLIYIQAFVIKSVFYLSHHTSANLISFNIQIDNACGLRGFHRKGAEATSVERLQKQPTGKA